MITNYEKVNSGHWYQTNLTGPAQTYNFEYSKSRYDTYSTNDIMSKLRYELIISNIGEFDSICDFGYGNGSFLKYCENQKKVTYGYDISDYPVPEKTIKINDPTKVKVDVYTFYDSLEHIREKNLVSFLKSLKAKNLVISVPWCHEYLGEEYFTKWKHRRENEHFHHFDLHGLLKLINDSNYNLVYVGNDEDKIRKSIDEHPNILTMIASKK